MKSDTTDIFYRPSEVCTSEHIGEVQNANIMKIQPQNMDTVASNTAYFTETGYLDDKVHNISNALLNSNFIPEMSNDILTQTRTQTQTGGKSYSETSEFIIESIDSVSPTDTNYDFPLSLTSKSLLSAITSNYHSIPNNDLETTYNINDINLHSENQINSSNRSASHHSARSASNSLASQHGSSQHSASASARSASNSLASQHSARSASNRSASNSLASQHSARSASNSLASQHGSGQHSASASNSIHNSSNKSATNIDSKKKYKLVSSSSNSKVASSYYNTSSSKR